MLIVTTCSYLRNVFTANFYQSQHAWEIIEALATISSSRWSAHKFGNIKIEF